MTELTNEALEALRREATDRLSAAGTPEVLERWRVSYIGRKGKLSQLLRRLRNIPADQRARVGQKGNELRRELEEAYHVKSDRLGPLALPRRLGKDNSQLTTLAGLPQPGHVHPLTITLRRIQFIFASLGFGIVEGPEVEDQTYNFDLLNIPPTHPTRAETDTFYLTNGHVMRVHTSPVQLRAVREHKLKPPFKILSPGRVFRSERTDATHETTFYQFEGLAVSTHTTIADFKGVIEVFYSRYFNTAVTSRLRPSYFPFVEPGFEVDIACIFCKQEGCRICKYSGWIEVMGAGMVHPVVLRNMGFDPDTYQGYAFGGAVDRITMLQYGIDDIRLFWSGNLNFLKQFS